MTDWLHIYRNTDDDTLAALGSTGLVRRAAKDVEAGKVAWETAPHLLRADGQLVRIDAGGPARASCDCPAPGVCKHILAAVIWLRNAAPEPGASNMTNAADGADSGPLAVAPPAGTSADAGASAANDPTAASAGDSAIDALSRLLAEVTALEPAAVFKTAGLAATRKAAALHAAEYPVTLSATAGTLLITLPSLDITCRYIGGAGFAGMVSEAPAASRAAVHVLALAAVWRQQGRAIAWPAPSRSAAAAALDDDAGLSADEQLFIERLRTLVLAAFEDGWSHVSEIVPAQLRALAMSARVESFPRLAGMLRTLAGTASLLVERDAGADERQAIRLATRIYALTHALEPARGDLLRELRGRERRSFDGNQALELLPLGAHWWEQRGGARGLSIAFWNPAAQGVMQAVLARRDHADRHFNRELAWSTASLWQGAGAAATLAGGALTLEQARVSDDLRLGLSMETRASVQPPWRANDERWTSAGYDDWNILADALRASAGLRGETLDCVLLRPARCDTPRLDEARQTFDWTVRDSSGAALALQLPCDPVHHQRIGNLEDWVANGAPIRAVLARYERSLQGGRLEPLTLIIETAGVLRAVSLDYEGAPASAARSAPLLQRLARLFGARPAAATAADIPAESIETATHAGWIGAMQQLLENQAMSGRLHVPGADRQRLVALRACLRASGVELLADALARYLDQPDTERGIALLYLCLTCAELGG